MKIHISNEWLKSRIENDADLPEEAGVELLLHETEFLRHFIDGDGEIKIEPIPNVEAKIKPKEK